MRGSAAPYSLTLGISFAYFTQNLHYLHARVVSSGRSDVLTDLPFVLTQPGCYTGIALVGCIICQHNVRKKCKQISQGASYEEAPRVPLIVFDDLVGAEDVLLGKCSKQLKVVEVLAHACLLLHKGSAYYPIPFGQRQQEFVHLGCQATQVSTHMSGKIWMARGSMSTSCWWKYCEMKGGNWFS